MSLDWLRLPANHKNEEAMLALRAECGWEGYGIYLSLLQSVLSSANLCLTSDERLLSVCSTVDERSLNACLTVLQRVQLVRNEGGKLFFTEVESAAEQARKRSEQSREAGKLSAEKRATNSKPVNKRSTVVQRSLSGSQPIRLDNTRLDNTKDNTPLTPQWVDLTEPLREWIAYRNESKKKLSERSISQIVKKYAGDPERLQRDVEHSVSNGYTGLFPPSSLNGHGNHQTKLTPAQEMLKLAAELEKQGL